MLASESYKRLVHDSIGEKLAEMGFSRHGFAFKKSQNNNLILIEFQKSDESTEGAIRFTVNLGVRYDRITALLTPEEIKRTPAIDQCQWRARLGQLLPEHRDEWWLIAGPEEAEPSAAELWNSLRAVFLDRLDTLSRDEWARDLWLSGASPGLTNQQRLMNLSILLKAIGPREALAPTIEELRKVAAGFLVDGMVRKLDRIR